MNKLPFDKTLEDWMEEIFLINEQKGWNEDAFDKSEGDWAALAHTEISEAFEACRNGLPLHFIDGDNENKPEGAAVEYMDCIIRILHWFKVKGISPSEVMNDKVQYNKTRPYRHGGKVF